MSIRLEQLYSDKISKYKIKLLTKSFYDKEVRWLHIIEYSQFTELMTGGELILNSSISSSTEEEMKDFLKKISEGNPAGVVIAARDRSVFSDEIIELCDHLRLPLLSAPWDTPYAALIHDLAEELIINQRRDDNRRVAISNALFRSDDTKTYMPLFGSDSFFFGNNYSVAVIGSERMTNESLHEWYDRLSAEIRLSLGRSVINNTDNCVIVTAADYDKKALKKAFGEICNKFPGTKVGIGDEVNEINRIDESYKKAVVAFKIHIDESHPVQFYSDLGIFQLLSDLKHEEILAQFAESVLGPLIKYDEENGTDYYEILERFFENECNASRTADSLFFHRNTMKYKLAAIRDILGYDVTLNENRLKIMLSFEIMKLSS